MDDRRVRIVREQSELGDWETVFVQPDPRLKVHVYGYQGFRENATRFVRRRELPFAGAALIINFGAAYRLFNPRDRGEASRQLSTFVAGPSDSYALSEATGPTCGVEVQFTPIGAHLLLGLPMGEIANLVVALDDVLGAAAAPLVARLREASSWEARFAILDCFIAARFARARGPSLGVAAAWRELNATHGGISIGTLAGGLGWSHKHLIAQFHEQVGLPPKTVARLIRFNRAVRLAEGNGCIRWAEIAHACGYYDQAHFNREFGAFAGVTPREFAVRRLPGGAGVIGD